MAAPMRKISDELPSRVTFDMVEATHQVKHAWEMVRTALLWQCPGFTSVLYKMLNPQKNEMVVYFTRDIPSAGTDGHAIYVNPDFMMKLPLGKQVFMTAHEILHDIFNHCGQRLNLQRLGEVVTSSGKKYPFDSQLLNIAQDLVINDLLVQCRVGEIDKGWLHDTTIATYQDSVVDVYGRLFKEQNQRRGGQPDKPCDDGQGGNGDPNQPEGERGNQKSHGVHMMPGQGEGKNPDKAAADRSEPEWTTAIASSMASAEAQGKLPMALKMVFQGLLEPSVSWQDKVRGFMARKCGGGAYDWTKADRRLITRDIYTPARSGHGAGLVVIGFDTSGSINADEKLKEYLIAEVGGILEEVNPERMIVVWCDAQVHGTEEVDKLTDVTMLKPIGGGGTSFVPVFDWVYEEGLTPDALIYLTDGWGTFPKDEPGYPVLWGSITDAHYPWGEVVRIPTDK